MSYLRYRGVYVVVQTDSRRETYRIPTKTPCGSKVVNNDAPDGNDAGRAVPDVCGVWKPK